MPRKSAAALATEALITAWGPPKPPEPPVELTPEQAAIWRQIAASRAPDFFDAGAQVLLVQYCRHAATADFLASSINALDPSDGRQFKFYSRLLTMHARETKAVMMLSTKLRLAPSNTRRIENKIAVPRRAPWEMHVYGR